jgi:hypothetical protein
LPWRIVPRQAQKAAALGDELVRSAEAARTGDQVKKVAVLAGGAVGPFTRGALAGIGTMQSDIETAAACIIEIAHDPIASAAATVGEIVPAHGLGVVSQAARQVGDAAGHRCLQGKRARR